ncbi:Carbonic anhydrase 9-like protein [Dinothrombium tinctorium]|uniref:Carbonic anhydrase n=1 Tax=Dinothrombium tinctorium TaxID=1965070 RepID=A0A3S4QNH6_9ACAR|nr:Carbonic anhydrase 9-like protein [Dinothrombium tinctorium]
MRKSPFYCWSILVSIANLIDPLLNAISIGPVVDPFLVPLPLPIDPFLVNFDRRFRRGRRISDAKPKNYSHRDQDNWAASFPACNLTQQSPISILSYGVETDPTLFIDFGPFYDIWLERAEMKNDGTTVEIEFMGGLTPVFSGSVVNNDLYRFHQMHFHWGSDDTVGSEHVIDGVQFPLELHMVHFNDKYTSLAQAASQPDGLSVLAILFKPSLVNNPFLDPLIYDLANVRCAYRRIDFNFRIILAQLLPVNTQLFFTYRGSLTTPPCFESVQWIIFRQLVPIGIAQLLQFRLLTSDAECRTLIGDNWRRVQPVNARVVRQPLLPVKGIW